MARLARWILAHARLVVLAWLAVAVTSLLCVSSASNALSQAFNLPGQPGFETDQAILQTYGNGGGNPPTVPVITLLAGTTVNSPGVRTQLGAALARVQQAVPRARIVSYASTGSRLFVSADGRTTFALVYLPLDPATGNSADLVAVQHALSRATVDGARFHVTGVELLASGGSGGGNSALVETVVGGIGALLVLAFVFGSLLAIVPLGMALVSIPTTFLLVWGLTAITDVSAIVEYLIALIGLGIAIDYSLLIVLRWREERARGLSNHDAVLRSMETAGKAVVFSGSTVAIGMLALVTLPIPVMRSIGYGGLLIPLVSVLVATTLLPAVLASAGPRVDWPRRRPERTSRFWSAWGSLIVRRRGAAAAVSAVVLALIMLPAASMVVGFPRATSLAQSGDAYEGLHALAGSGIGAGPLLPIEVLVRQADPRVVAAEMARLPDVRGAVAPAGTAWRAGSSTLVAVVASADGTSPAGKAALSGARRIAAQSAGSIRVGGGAAENSDFLSAVYDNFPRMVAILAVLTFVLLARAFRSILLPLKAVTLVLVSVGAACGFMTFVWQDGHGSGLLWGIPATGSVTSWIPVMVFAFLFGISMDYEVFLLSRMREVYDATGSTTEAVVRGIGSTGRLVTSAAVILFLAFGALASGPEVNIKIIATGLAAGIIVDATVIRMLLVPALISLFGRWNWWLPVPMARVLGISSTTPATAVDEALTLERIA